MNEKDFIEIDIEEIEPIELSDWEKINIEKCFTVIFNQEVCI